MNLLNRYLQEVAKYLPKARRDDIVEELRANLLSQIEDREQEFGRPLNEDELVAILKHHGNPAFVAGRYREDNRGLAFGIQLIGPELFPFYKTILAINFSITLVVLAVVMPILARVIREPITLSRVLVPLAAQFGAVTLIFILLDRGKGHWLNRWDPGKLPPLKANLEDGPSARKIFDFICLAVGTLWVALTPRWPYLMLGPGSLYSQYLPMKLRAQWIEFYWAILVLLCAQLMLQLIVLLRRLPRRKARIADLILKIAGLCLGIFLMFQNYVVATGPGHQELVLWANLTFRLCVLVAVAINLWGIFQLLSSLLRERHQMLPARQY
jgi:hypothetical protein